MKKLTSLPLYQFVYTNEVAFVRAMAIEHALQNLGHVSILEDRFTRTMLQAQQQCIEAHADSISEVEAEAYVHDEVNSWVDDSKKTLEVIKKESMPWTLTSSRLVFDRPGYLKDK